MMTGVHVDEYVIDLMQKYVRSSVVSYFFFFKHKSAYKMLRTYVRTYVRTYARTYVGTYVRTYLRTYVRTYVRACVRACVRRYVPVSDTHLTLPTIFRVVSTSVRMSLHTKVYYCMYTHLRLYSACINLSDSHILYSFPSN